MQQTMPAVVGSHRNRKHFTSHFAILNNKADINKFSLTLPRAIHDIILKEFTSDEVLLHMSAAQWHIW